MMTMERECQHYDDCDAPLCPLRTRGQNSHYAWFGWDEVCQKEGDVPFWLKQQREIDSQIKIRNRHTVFELMMLEAPLKITRHVKGLNPEAEDNSFEIRKWFWENNLRLPEKFRMGLES
jgi:hypothetical protein